jgi:hypothetical protein
MKKLALAAALALSATLANAAPIGTVVSTTNNGYNGSLGLLNNDIFPDEGSAADAGSEAGNKAPVWWNGNGADKVFQFTFNDLYRLEDVTLSVDHNDRYVLEYSPNSTDWYALFSVAVSLGEIGSGMDTMSTVVGDPEYVSQIDFSPVEARAVRISASDGNKPYAIGEVTFFGTRVAQQASLPPASVPEPGMLALLGAALGAGALTRRRRGN